MKQHLDDIQSEIIGLRKQSEDLRLLVEHLKAINRIVPELPPKVRKSFLKSLFER